MPQNAFLTDPDYPGEPMDDYLLPDQITQLPREEQPAQWAKVPSHVMADWYRQTPAEPPIDIDTMPRPQRRPRGRPPIAEDSQLLKARVASEHVALFDELIKKEGKTRAEVIRHLIELYIDARTGENRAGMPATAGMDSPQVRTEQVLVSS